MIATAPLSDRQQRILDYVQEYWVEHGYSPAIREIGGACDISSTSVVVYHLNRLTLLGYLTRRPDYVARGISLAGGPCCACPCACLCCRL